MQKIIAVSGMTIIALATAGCGSKNSSGRKSYTALAASAETSTASSLLQEAVDSAGAGESADSTATSLTATSTGDQSKGFSPNRICTASGTTATVTITGDLNRTFSTSGAKRSRERTVTGSLNETRAWTHSSETLACTTANTARVGSILDDATKITGLTLTVNNNRERTFSTTITNNVKNTQTTTSRSVRVTGTRTINWVSQTTESDVIVRVKTVAANTTRTMTENGSAATWTIATPTPLTITVWRYATAPKALVAKKISGTLVSSLSTDTTQTIEKTFTDFKMVVDSDGMCTASSGTLSISFKKSGTETQKYTCTVEDSNLSCTDKDNAEVPVEIPDCDPVDNT